MSPIEPNASERALLAEASLKAAQRQATKAQAKVGDLMACLQYPRGLGEASTVEKRRLTVGHALAAREALDRALGHLDGDKTEQAAEAERRLAPDGTPFDGTHHNFGAALGWPDKEPNAREGIEYQYFPNAALGTKGHDGKKQEWIMLDRKWFCEYTTRTTSVGAPVGWLPLTITHIPEPAIPTATEVGQVFDVWPTAPEGAKARIECSHSETQLRRGCVRDPIYEMHDGEWTIPVGELGAIAALTPGKEARHGRVTVTHIPEMTPEPETVARYTVGQVLDTRPREDEAPVGMIITDSDDNAEQLTMEGWEGVGVTKVFNYGSDEYGPFTVRWVPEVTS